MTKSEWVELMAEEVRNFLTRHAPLLQMRTDLRLPTPTGPSLDDTGAVGDDSVGVSCRTAPFLTNLTSAVTERQVLVLRVQEGPDCVGDRRKNLFLAESLREILILLSAANEPADTAAKALFESPGHSSSVSQTPIDDVDR